MKLTRRSFLTGAVATAAAAALPAPMENPCAAVILPDSHFGAIDFGALESRTIFWYLHPAQYRFFEAEGFDMSHAKLVEPIMLGDQIYGRSACQTNGVIFRAPASSEAVRGPAHNLSQTGLRDALKRVMHRKHADALARQMIGSRRSAQIRPSVRASRGRNNYA